MSQFNDFRNITSLIDPDELPPTFAEYESCFEAEGFEDFGSWNPVSIDDIITNCQHFEVGDDKTNGLAILQAVATGPFAFASTSAFAFVNSDSDDDSDGDIDDGPTLLAVTDTTSRPQKQQRPTCYACLFPHIVMPTHFKTRHPLEVAVTVVEDTLKEKELSFRFNASECTWSCSYLNNASHGSFVVRIYRYPASLGSIHHAVEMQRLDGDAWIFRSIYELLNEKLRDETLEEAVPIWPRPADYVEVEDDVKEEPQEPATAEEQQPFVVPDLAALISVIVATLRHGRLSAVVESTQLACSIYSGALSTPQEIDIDCLRELMRIVIDSETNSDWASQHSVLAITSMSKSPEYCEKILSMGDLSDEFVKAIFALANPGTFNTQTMRCECVKLLDNLLKTNEDYVFNILDKREVLVWRNTTFVTNILG